MLEMLKKEKDEMQKMIRERSLYVSSQKQEIKSQMNMEIKKL